MEKETGRFQAESDEGRVFTVVVIQEIIEDRRLTGHPSSTRLGLRELFLSDRSSAVNQIDPVTFKIVETDQIIRKVR